MGDLLIGVDGQELSHADELDAALASGQWPLTLRLVRGQEALDVTVELEA